MEQVINETLLPQMIMLDTEQFEQIVEFYEKLVELCEYNSRILLAVLCFVAVGCGVLLANIFSRYVRG